MYGGCVAYKSGNITNIADLYTDVDFLYVFVMLLLLCRTLVAVKRKAYALFVIILYECPTHSYNSLNTRNMDATYPIYILCQFANYPQYSQLRKVAENYRIWRDIQRMH